MQFSTTHLKTLDDKNAEVAERREASKALVESVERAMRIVEADEDVGCFACSLFRRFRGSRAFSDPAAATACGASSSSTGSSAGKVTKKGLFGKKKADPSKKLQEAASAMQDRVRHLEGRVDDSKAEAARFVKMGQKQQALRSLKRAKGYEKQVQQNQGALDALEQQVDMLAQSEMQRTIADALSHSSKGIQKHKDLLKHAENAIDGATEVRDFADDLNGVIGDFASGSTNDFDDDELMAELNAMVETAPPPNPPQNAANGDDEAAEMAAAAARLASKHAAWDEAEEVRRARPAAGKNGKNGKKKAVLEENVGLISAQ